MTSPEERIRELARKSAIAPADAERLLAAVRTEPVAKASWNPYDRWSAERCIAIGVACAVVGIALSRLGFRYDGFLDQNYTRHGPSLFASVVDQLAAFPFGALVFWAAARIVARRARFVDLLGVVGLARLPATVFSIPLAVIGPKNVAGDHMTVLGGVALVIAVVGLGLQITALVVGFRTSTGVAGARFTLSLLGALLVAELGSKVIVSFVP
jgi:hypothetical protein